MKQDIKSSINEIKDFVNHSIIWQDMLGEMDAWLKDIRDQLENSDGAMSSRILDRLGGNAETLRNLQNLPHVLIDILEGLK